MNITKTDDLKGFANDALKLDLTPFVGAWSNTKTDSGQLPYVELRTEEDVLYLKAFGAGENGLVDWGEARCTVFAPGISDATAIAFLASFQIENIEVQISANVKLGVLVLQTYTTFRDDSNRFNYYAREFYGPAQT